MDSQKTRIESKLLSIADDYVGLENDGEWKALTISNSDWETLTQSEKAEASHHCFLNPYGYTVGEATHVRVGFVAETK